METALKHGIRVLSWTYNDPVVWHEFILDTAKLAKEAGLINLYKSAFFISEEAIDELLPVIDIFSISLKSISPNTTGRSPRAGLSRSWPVSRKSTTPANMLKSAP